MKYYYKEHAENTGKDRPRYHDRPECLMVAKLKGENWDDFLYNDARDALNYPTYDVPCHACGDMITKGDID